MNKKLTLEDIVNLESTKLFKDLGYELWNDVMIYESKIVFSYDKKDDYRKGINFVYNWDNNHIKFYTRDQSDIGPFMYPITKLLEELQIDIEQIYLKELKGDKK